MSMASEFPGEKSRVRMSCFDFKQNIKVESTNKFTFNMKGLEEIWFEFAGSNSLEKHKRIFGCIYRHPSQKNSQKFLTSLNNWLANLNLAIKQ